SLCLSVHPSFLHKFTKVKPVTKSLSPARSIKSTQSRSFRVLAASLRSRDVFLNVTDFETVLMFMSFTALKKGRFWITPDPYHNDDNIQIGREVKISCQVEATPPEELTFSWLKNGRALRSSERMVITQTDPDISPGTTNLDIIDLKFTDFGTYTCVAALKGGGIPEISIDVNISSTTGESLRRRTSRRWSTSCITT
uniref:Ig-like domain-containing protein n=1 Tax=Periophthalmus magnuspinnatus TaxID=409849 RepID=A0A3B4BAG1_9GOBI